jgi:hypothetical protein
MWCVARDVAGRRAAAWPLRLHGLAVAAVEAAAAARVSAHSGRCFRQLPRRATDRLSLPRSLLLLLTCVLLRHALARAEPAAAGGRLHERGARQPLHLPAAGALCMGFVCV